MKKKFDVITIGSVTQDTYLMSPKPIPHKKSSKSGSSFSFPLGTKIELKDIHIEVGGGATNAAATFTQFGFSTAVFVECGDDPTGEYVLSELCKLHIDTCHVRIEKGGRTAYSVFFLAPNGERTVFVYRGASAGLKLNTSVIARIDPKWLYITSVGGDLRTLQDVWAVSGRGTNIAWNPGKSELARGVKSLRPFLVSASVTFVNAEEAQGLFGKTYSEKALLKKIRSCTENVVVITNDRHGSYAFVDNTVYSAHIKPVVARDTTGAGDAFGSGFITGLMKAPGRFDAALFTGSANAMSVVQKVGAKHGLISPQHLYAFKKRIRITQKTYASI
ncbi:MAG: carbohydrate kinase family protein [Patescibacteria group bacterium]